MTEDALPRRAALGAAILMLDAAAASAAGPASGDAPQDTAPSASEVVRRWGEAIARDEPMPIARDAHPDIVLTLHGFGSMPDGRPRVLEGLQAVTAWFEFMRGRIDQAPRIRMLMMTEQQGTVVTVSESVATLRPETPGGAPLTRTGLVFAVYTVRDGRIARIVRFADRLAPSRA